ncbi:30S ribosomal protein S6 [Clavibacter nebraskensis]
MTHQYELMVILDPEIDERTVAPSLDKFLNVIRTSGGTVDSVDVWGRRRLAYEINKKNEGIYAVVQLTATSEATQELDRQLGLSEAVMRTKVLRAEEAMAMVASARKLADEKVARKAAATSKAADAAPQAPATDAAPATPGKPAAQAASSEKTGE